jgi:multimeric flavodoxin WrbA
MTEVKILGVSGSPRKKISNTAKMVRWTLEGAAALEGVETEFVDLAELRIEHCNGCRSCRRKKVPYCPPFDDDMNSLYPKLMEADGVILGSPVYFASVTSLTKAFMDRTTCLGGSVGFKLKYKVGAGITVGGTRHGGQEYTLMQLHNYFLMMGAVVVTGIPPTGYWGAAGVAGKVDEDRWVIEGREHNVLDVCFDLGQRVAIVAKLIKAGAQMERPELLEFSAAKTAVGAY